MENKNAEQTVLPTIETDRPDESSRGVETVPAPPGQGVGEVAYQESSATRQRPVGVAVIAIANFVGALLISLLLLISIVENLDLGIRAVIWPVDVAIAIAVGIGLVQLKNWARILAFVGYGINIALDIYSMLTGPVDSGTLFNLAIAVIIIWYLRQPKVAEVFE